MDAAIRTGTMSKKRRRVPTWVFSLRTRLIVISILCIVFPTSVVTLLYISNYKEQAQQESTDTISGALGSVSQSIYSYISEIERLMTTIGYDPDVLYAMETSAASNDADNGGVALETGSDSGDRYKSTRIQNYLTASRKELLSIAIQDSSGGLQYHNRNINVSLRSDLPGGHGLYEYMLSEVNNIAAPYTFIGKHTPEYYTFSMNKRVFSIIQTMQHPYNPDKNLYIMADTDVAFFQRLFLELSFNAPFVAMVLDSNGDIVYATAELPKNALNWLYLGVKTIHVGDEIYHVASQAIIPTGWKVMILLSDVTLRSKIQSVFRTNMLIAVSIIIISALTYTVLSNHITDSFKEMASVMKKAREGNLTVSCSTSGNDELAELKCALNEMISRLNTYIDKEYRLTLDQRNAEYRALQSQIQPHFLYNTLNGFIYLNREGQRETLENSIIDLTELLRYTLGKETMVPIALEFDFLEKYCELQKLRFEEKMNYSIICSKSVSSLIIPKLILQPLVENSVVHAVEPSVGTCSIRISANTEMHDGNTYVSIIVADDGEGFETAKIECGSVGISNVRDRLALCYPDSCFDIKSAVGQGTCITILIPLSNFDLLTGGDSDENTDS